MPKASEAAVIEAIALVAKAASVIRADGGTNWQRPVKDAIFRWWDIRNVWEKSPKRRHSLAARDSTQKTTADHAVPNKVMIERIVQKSSKGEDIRTIIDSFCEIVVLTKDEDVALNKAGLRSCMPSDWNGKDRYARYRAVGIAIEEGEFER